LLLNFWSWPLSLIHLWEKDTFAPTAYNLSQELSSFDCCSPDWLDQLQQPFCPLVRLLVLGLLALPLYNAVLVLVGWRLNCSSSSNAERMLSEIRVQKVIKRPAPQPPRAPEAPPRNRRRPAPKPPVHIRRSRTPETYPCQRNSNGTLKSKWDQSDQYENLRRNLQQALEGLQKPPPPAPPSPELEIIPLQPPEDGLVTVPEESSSVSNQKRRNKLILAILNRLGMSSQRSILHPIWRRLRHRTIRKKFNNTVASTSSSSSTSSYGSSCFYVY
ncbi:hypothetical protein KR009_005113, partial [Drosophila setifemur]